MFLTDEHRINPSSTYITIRLNMTAISKFKKRTYLDPIHGPIELFLDDALDNLLSRLIDSSEFQRLRRIKQMGTGWFVFHGAEHTRFGHSLGAMFNAQKVINHLSKKHFEINKYEVQILVSALLHDIGHGPFSHTSETLCNVSHESWTKKIITGNTEINKILIDFDKKLPGQVIDLMNYKSVPPYASQIISSYIDCDRLDYLHRDSYYVGVPYGLTGSDRIIASLDIDKKDKLLIVDERLGLDAVIHYLHARYSMYQQVYQHKKNIASDFVLKKIVERIKEVKPKTLSKHILNWALEPESLSLDAYLNIDDIAFFNLLKTLSEDKTDQILFDLSNSFLNRYLFKSLEFRVDISAEKINGFLKTLKKIAKAKGLNEKYYLGIQKSHSSPYEPYEISKDKKGKAVYIRQKNGQIKELSMVSGLVKALSAENIEKNCLIFTPELESDLISIKGFNDLFR